MRDDDYLAEEAGRRATANRLLDLIGAHRPSGRLLDVGCGHGLLLDEARKRGYETVGLELSREAARHARSLGLDVRELPLEAFGEGTNGDSPGSFDVVVLADVLEHLDDPVPRSTSARRCCGPSGVLCIVTPDPSSATAKLAGRALVGLPARAHVPAPAPHAARADLRARADHLRGRAVRAHVRGQALGGRAGGAARARRRAA